MQKRAKLMVFVISSSFCDLVHALSVVDLFAKQLNNALNVPKIRNRRAKSQNAGVRRAIFLKRLSRRATWEHCNYNVLGEGHREGQIALRIAMRAALMMQQLVRSHWKMRHQLKQIGGIYLWRAEAVSSSCVGIPIVFQPSPQKPQVWCTSNHVC